MGVAFFDLDKTLISRNSGSLWLRRELREGHIGPAMALQASWWLLRYHLGTAKMEYALEQAIGTLAGKDEAEMVARTDLFYDEEVQHLLRPGAREALEHHRAAGDALVLLTSSSNYLSRRVVADHGLDAFLSNAFEVTDGRYTGRSAGPLCFGEGKVLHARAFLQDRPVELADCAFYTDSMSDLPVLDVVGRPRVVNPDPRLAREAKRRGWPIHDWGEPGMGVVE